MRIITVSNEDIPYEHVTLYTVPKGQGKSVIVASNMFEIKPSMWIVSKPADDETTEAWLDMIREAWRMDMKFCDFRTLDEDGEPQYVR